MAFDIAPMSTETQLRQDIRGFAGTVRELAYKAPGGVGEWALLQLSSRMLAAAEQS